jgi:Calcineurin-like phosphoesterase
MPRAPKAAAPLTPVFHEPIFNEAANSVDPTGFATRHPSDNAQYAQLKALLTKSVVGFEKMRGAPNDLFRLRDAYGPHGAQIEQAITKAGKIVFHSLGDSGASNMGTYKDEVRVGDQVSLDCQTSDDANRPAFLYHLGDIVYSFGESDYYYDQFYEPFRNYPGPILAIPGNHDSFVVPRTPEGQTPLETFVRNFCATAPLIAREARSLHRTAMTQPGVYYTLDAPFVRIIGLFSNALEDPGVISAEGKTWSNVPDFQLEYLEAQLKRIHDEKYTGALLIAMHHPPFSYAPPKGVGGAGGNHSSSSAMLRQIDTICKKFGIYPHAFLSGHAHNYQRYTRTVRFSNRDFDVPFIICGDGGHHVNRLVQGRKGQPPVEPHMGIKVDYLEHKPVVEARGLLLEKYDDINYGYLRITVDKELLRIGFHQVGASSLAQSRFDMVTVDLASHSMVSN